MSTLAPTPIAAAVGERSWKEVRNCTARGLSSGRAWIQSPKHYNTRKQRRNTLFVRFPATHICLPKCFFVSASTSKIALVRITASNRSFSVSGDDGKERPGQRGSQSRGSRRTEQNENSIKTKSPPSSSKSSEASYTQVKGGLAGLATLKTQLEQERPRISRVKASDVLLLNKRTKLQRKKWQESPVIQTKESPKSDASNAHSSYSLSSDSEAENREDSSFLILVRNLDRRVTEEEYQQVMQSIPEITFWRYLRDKEGLCRGYGFCGVHAEADVAAVVQVLSGQTLQAKKIEASFYKSPKKSKVLQRSADETNASSPDVKQVKSSSLEGKVDASTSYINQPRRSSMEDETNASVIDVKELNSPRLELSDANESARDGDFGQRVLEALQRAPIRARDQRKRKGRSSALSKTTDSDDEDSSQGLLPPLVFKAEWASRIEELEKEVKNLRLLR